MTEAVPETEDHILKTYGRHVEDVYKLGLRYYTQEEGNLKLHYDHKSKFYAFRKQVRVGKFNEKQMPELGLFDWVGRDRRNAWQALGDMPKQQAMIEFLVLLEKTAPAWKDWAHAEINAIEEAERLEAELKAREEKRRRETAEREERRKAEMAAAAAAAAASVAASQQQQQAQQQQKDQSREASSASHHGHSHAGVSPSTATAQGSSAAPTPAATQYLPLAFAQPQEGGAARVAKFIEAKRQDPDSVLQIARGETITIRCPITQPNVVTVWEFATEYYDIGFGVSFEYVENDQTKIDNILPVQRCESYGDIMTGSQLTNRVGVYLLKFDNSYSLLRSKTLFYHVVTKVAK